MRRVEKLLWSSRNHPRWEAAWLVGLFWCRRMGFGDLSLIRSLWAVKEIAKSLFLSPPGSVTGMVTFPSMLPALLSRGLIQCPLQVLGWLLLSWSCVRLTFRLGAMGGENWDSGAQVSVKSMFLLTPQNHQLKMLAGCWLSCCWVLCALSVTKFQGGESLSGFEEIPL